MNDIARTLGGVLGGGLVVIVLFSIFMLFVGYPLIAFSVLRRLRGIQAEFSRLNETLAGKMTIAKTGPLGI